MAQLRLAECDAALPECAGSGIAIGDIADSRTDLKSRLDCGHTTSGAKSSKTAMPVRARGLPCLTELSTSCLLAAAVGASILLWLAIIAVI